MRTYADQLTYDGAGLPLQERFGTNTNLYHNRRYNNRLQLADVRLGDSADLRSRGQLTFYYGTTAKNAFDIFANSTDNNGNLLMQEHRAPQVGGGVAYPQQDQYFYDDLNRITKIYESQQTTSGVWNYGILQQAYSY